MEFLKVPLAQVKRCVCCVRHSGGETTLKTPSLPARLLKDWEVLRCSQTDQCHHGELQPRMETHQVWSIHYFSVNTLFEYVLLFVHVTLGTTVEAARRLTYDAIFLLGKLTTVISPRSFMHPEHIPS